VSVYSFLVAKNINMTIEKAKAAFSQHFPTISFCQIKRLSGGHINSTYLVEYELNHQKVSVVFQYLNPAIFSQPAAIWNNISRVGAHLKTKPYRYQILDFHPHFILPPSAVWRVFPYFEDTFTLEKCENAIFAKKAAKAFAHHLAMLSDLPLCDIQTIIPDFHNATWRYQQFKTALSYAKPERIQQAKIEIELIEASHYLVEQYNDCIVRLPPRLTHNDTKISNLLFDKNSDEPCVIIDLDTLQVGTVLSDFGDMVRSYCSTHSEEATDFDAITFRHDIFDALKEGFLEETDAILTTIEKESLFFAGELTIYVQAMRFLTDFLNNDIYYATTYEMQNWNRSRNQLRLLEKMRCL
jgi:thiamine kinase-like enzyme